MAKKPYKAYNSGAPKPILTEAEAWPKLLRYCAYQERSPAEVTLKMRSFGLDYLTQERLLEKLKEENYLSVDRFAQAYAGGKLRTSKWGQRKIALGLAAKGIEKEVIADKLSNLAPQEIQLTLRNLLVRRDTSTYSKLPPFERRTKLYRLGLSHGFSSDLVREEVNRLLKNLPYDDDFAPPPEVD